MAFDVWPTALAVQDLASLRGPVLKAARQAREEFEASGCAAAHYRLEGAELRHVCCRHLHGAWRMIVAFPTADEVCVLLVGQHDATAPSNVYGRLYETLGIGPPVGERNKPPCCADAADPPINEDLVSQFVEVSARARRGR